jgi:hypothetical protein
MLRLTRKTFSRENSGVLYPDNPMDLLQILMSRLLSGINLW